MTGMAAISKPMIITLVGEKWLFAATLLIPMCLTSMWYPVHAMNLNLLQVKGRSDLFLRLEIIKKIIGVIVLVVSIPFGLVAMCWIRILSSISALVINTYYTGKLVNFGFWRQMKDYSSSLFLSLFMGVAVWITLNFIPFPPPILLAIGFIEGAIIYLAGAIIFRFPELKEIRSLINRKKNTPIPEQV